MTTPQFTTDRDGHDRGSGHGGGGAGLPVAKIKSHHAAVTVCHGRLSCDVLSLIMSLLLLISHCTAAGIIIMRSYYFIENHTRRSPPQPPDRNGQNRRWQREIFRSLTILTNIFITIAPLSKYNGFNLDRFSFENKLST